MAETLQDRLQKYGDALANFMPFDDSDRRLAARTMREAAAKLDELESRLPLPDRRSEEPDISDRWLWNEALDLHRGSQDGSANGLHIYFALQRVRKSAIAVASTGGNVGTPSHEYLWKVIVEGIAGYDCRTVRTAHAVADNLLPRVFAVIRAQKDGE